MHEDMKKYTNLLFQKRYSKNTIKTYCNYFKDFLYYFEAGSIQNVKTNHINSHFLFLINSRNISISQQNQRIYAIKFYYKKVFVREKNITNFIALIRNTN